MNHNLLRGWILYLYFIFQMVNYGHFPNQRQFWMIDILMIVKQLIHNWCLITVLSNERFDSGTPQISNSVVSLSMDYVSWHVAFKWPVMLFKCTTVFDLNLDDMRNTYLSYNCRHKMNVDLTPSDWLLLHLFFCLLIFRQIRLIIIVYRMRK